MWNSASRATLEQVSFSRPWTQRPLTQPGYYDLNHLLPLSVYPVNELWNLVPAGPQLLAATYATYQRSVPLARAVREDAGLRFGPLPGSADFSRALAHQALQFLDEVASARLVGRF